MAAKSKKNTIFSILDRDIICQHKKDVLPRFPEITFHNHDGYEIYLFLDGDTDYYVEGLGKTLERGDLILTAPYAFHYSDSKPTSTYERIFVNIKDTYMKALEANTSIGLPECFSRVPDYYLNLLKLSEHEIAVITSIADEMEKNLDNYAYGKELFSNALLTQLLVIINRKTLVNEINFSFTSVMPPLVKKTISFINDNLSETISMKNLSEYVHHNPDYICRCFKSITGVSLQQFILAKRITLAQKHLIAGVSPCDACFMSGFNNYSNFSRTFSNHTGMSPKQYQLKQRK